MRHTSCFSTGPPRKFGSGTSKFIGFFPLVEIPPNILYGMLGMGPLHKTVMTGILKRDTCIFEE